MSEEKKFNSVDELLGELDSKAVGQRVRAKEFVLNLFESCWRPFQDARYWVLNRTTRRHHVIKTGLPPGWYDENTLILYSCMVLLNRFVEWHGGEEELERFTNELRDHPDQWGSNTEEMSLQIHSQTKALEIYRWWKTYPLYAKRLDDLYKAVPTVGDIERYKLVNDFEEQILADEQAMLHLLIEIRPDLWT